MTYFIETYSNVEIVVYSSVWKGKKKLEKIELGLPSQTLVSHPKPTSFNENLLEKCEEGLRGKVVSLLQFILKRGRWWLRTGCWSEMQAVVSAIQECLGHLGSIQSSTGDFLSKRRGTTWSPYDSVSCLQNMEKRWYCKIRCTTDFSGR